MEALKSGPQNRASYPPHSSVTLRCNPSTRARASLGSRQVSPGTDAAGSVVPEAEIILMFHTCMADTEKAPHRAGGGREPQRELRGGPPTATRSRERQTGPLAGRLPRARAPGHPRHCC